MFDQLIVQIRHQYGKYLNFDNAYTDSKEKVYGMKNGFYEDETIVSFIAKKDGYQIKHQYGKYLNFDNAYTDSKEGVFGMSKGFYEDETIVHIIPKNGGYQLKHQYGKYLNFDHAYSNSKERVYGMSKGFYQDETIVHFIPIKYTFFIKINEFSFVTNAISDAKRNGQIENISLINKTFCNKTSHHQKFKVNESVSFKTNTTFTHTKKDVSRWINKVSVGIQITADAIVPLPKGLGAASLGFENTWENESVEEFTKSTFKSVQRTIDVEDEITVCPHTKMEYQYTKKLLSDVAIPYNAVMEIRCKMGGIYVSDEALQFILDYIGDCPTGTIKMKNGCGIYCTELTGKLKSDIAMDFETDCYEVPL